ncbi:YeeE/YedE thiosulfate transporter family protein [Deferrisoma sp.]
MTATAWKRAVAVGAAIGALNLGHYALTARAPGLEVPFGIFPGGFPVAAMAAAAGRLSPELKIMLVFGLGVVIGAAGSAYRTGGFVWHGRLPVRELLQGLAGGMVMAVGVWMAQGCLNKHGLSGTPGLMLSSWVTMAGIAATAWLLARPGRRGAR